MSRFAADINDFSLADYQYAVRTVLRYPFITDSFPNPRALRMVRRHAATLAVDMKNAFGYQLLVQGDIARLLRFRDQLDSSQPATNATGRVFDPRRYAYLSLVVALLARSGAQTTLSELGELLKADANRIASLGFDDDQYHHRRAYVDVIGWLEQRSVLVTADGSTQQWLSDHGNQDALYDIDRDALFLLWRSRVMLQTLDSVNELLGDRIATDSEAGRRELAGKAARRAVIDNPVAYFAEYPDTIGNHLRGNALAEDLQRLTGLPFERRAEGVLLVDTARWSVEAFPREGGIANAALLLLVECCDRYLDPDQPTTTRETSGGLEMLPQDIDSAIPTETHIADTTKESSPREEPVAASAVYPFITDDFLFQALRQIMERHGANFGKDFHEDPARLLREAVDLLQRFTMVRRVRHGIVLLPLAARYRNTVFESGPHVQEKLFLCRVTPPKGPGSLDCGITPMKSSSSPMAGWCCADPTVLARPRS